MKGEELIKEIKDYKLEEYDLNIMFEDGYNVFPIFRTLKVVGIGDIGHSSRIISLEGELDDCLEIKGKYLIKEIRRSDLGNFEVTASFTDEPYEDGTNMFPNVRTLNITGIGDIGYSTGVAYLDGELDV